ncbi:MAG: hypothetical protein SWN10_24165 [Pseudomonadota bacterium]|nr:hypothetical protein [Pseudomonadota bacterium]
MSGKFLARVSALSLALLLVACGGDDSSSPLAGTGTDGGETSTSEGTVGTTPDAGTGTTQEVVIGLGSGFGSSFVEGQIETGIGSDTLTAGGQTKLTVYIVDKNNNNSLITNEQVEVSFSSNCVSTKEAQIESPILTSGGVAETTYIAQGCSPQDLIKAEVGAATASVAIDIAAPIADRVVAVPLTTTSIAPIGAGSTSRPSEAPVSFKVVDSNGNGLKGVDVTFSLSGDDPTAETPVSLSTEGATSTTGGEVSTLVIAGSASTTVRVIATIQKDTGPESTQSEAIAINSLIPTDAGFTLTSDNYLPDAQFTAGVQVAISAFATDRNGQNIRGNTIINFTADGGSITPDCTLSEEGICTVSWRSQSPWLTQPTITATTIGETSTGTVGTISESLRLFVSSSRDPQITLSEGVEPQQYCASADVRAADASRIHPANGTTIDFAISEGEILSAKSSFTVNGENGIPDDTTKYTACVFAKLTDATVPGTLTATVTTPGDEIAEDLLVLPATATP